MADSTRVDLGKYRSKKDLNAGFNQSLCEGCQWSAVGRYNARQREYCVLHPVTREIACRQPALANGCGIGFQPANGWLEILSPMAAVSHFRALVGEATWSNLAW